MATGPKLKLNVIKGQIKTKEVYLEDFGLDAVIYPVGFKHLETFGGQIAGLTALIVKNGLNVDYQIKGEKPTEQEEEEITKLMGQKIIGIAMPYVMANMMGMIKDCVKLVSKDQNIDVSDCRVDDLPHWELPAIIEAWIDISFNEPKKYRPWLEVVDKMVGKLTGKPFSISETLSKLSSRADTPSETSSTGANPDAHIKDGASNNSSSGASEPNDTNTENG